MLYITYFSAIEAGLHIHLISDLISFSNVVCSQSTSIRYPYSKHFLAVRTAPTKTYISVAPSKSLSITFFYKVLIVQLRNNGIKIYYSYFDSHNSNLSILRLILARWNSYGYAYSYKLPR